MNLPRKPSIKKQPLNIIVDYKNDTMTDPATLLRIAIQASVLELLVTLNTIRGLEKTGGKKPHLSPFTYTFHRKSLASYSVCTMSGVYNLRN
jgi:hypothetical protein